ncbi:hypothetical protein CEXT_44651 [Caerostris extrusa]|uniref:Reverse transcriptase domain-containing protein n=1 Tax=Caerostris extrusa TaxID=172846 RepID=A0AAV4QHM4_CAEEX|nr:hypothetical protein CEXT_44651 [Caerostris extrusa]
MSIDIDSYWLSLQGYGADGERQINLCPEKKCLLSKYQSEFHSGRCTLDNILFLETAIQKAFVTQKLVSIFFDMEKAYNELGVRAF